VMFPPGATDVAPVFVTLTSALAAATVVVAVAVLLALFASAGDDAAIVAVLVITVPPVTFTTRVNTAFVPFASVELVAVSVPVPPAGGVVDVQPAGAVKDTNVALAGMTSVNVSDEASDGPAFATVIV
jgi:hypothetical protein